MKFHLVKDATVPVNLLNSGTLPVQWTLTLAAEGFNSSLIPFPFKEDDDEEKFSNLRSKLKSLYKEYMDLALFIGWGQTYSSTIFVGIQGKCTSNCILEVLGSCFGEKARIQVELNLGGGSSLFGPEFKIRTKELLLDFPCNQNPAMPFKPIHWKDPSVRLPYRRLVSSPGTIDLIQNRSTCTITVTIYDKIGDYEIASRDVPSSFGNQRILEEELFTDVVIVASNGSKINSHKSFLAAHSSVFLAMFQADMKESRESILEVPDMTEEGVRAMLKYIYYSDIKSAEEFSLVAFELLNAGHKYDIQGLEEAMRKLLISKPNDWYEVDVAVKLFFFARNLTSVDDNMKMKAVQVLQFYASDLKTSPTCKELFKKDLNAALELMQFVLTTGRFD